MDDPLDWLIHEGLPGWLALVPSLAEHAEALRALPDIVDEATAWAAGEAVGAVFAAAQTAAESHPLAEDQSPKGTVLPALEDVAAQAVEDEPILAHVAGVWTAVGAAIWAAAAAARTGTDLSKVKAPHG